MTVTACPAPAPATSSPAPGPGAVPPHLGASARFWFCCLGGCVLPAGQPRQPSPEKTSSVTQPVSHLPPGRAFPRTLGFSSALPVSLHAAPLPGPCRRLRVSGLPVPDGRTLAFPAVCRSGRGCDPRLGLSHHLLWPGFSPTVSCLQGRPSSTPAHSGNRGWNLASLTQSPHPKVKSCQICPNSLSGLFSCCVPVFFLAAGPASRARSQ